MKAPSQRSVLVLECEPLARRGLAATIGEHPALRVCAQAATAAEARALCQQHRPDVLVFDPTQDDGFALLRDLTNWGLPTCFVAITAREDAATLQRALREGVLGYLARRDPPETLLAAILAALAGERTIGPRILRVLLGDIARGAVGTHASHLALLSSREADVFHLLGQGRSNRAIAEALHLDIKTVQTYGVRIRQKLGLTSAAELQHAAWLHAQNPPPPPPDEPEVSGRMILEC